MCNGRKFLLKKVSLIKITLGVILLVSLGGCSSSDSLPADVAGQKPNATGGYENVLDGSSWNLYSYRVSILIEGTSFTLSFEEGQVPGNAGCNSFFGSYTEDQNHIAISDLGMTEMACMQPEGLMHQEQDLLAMLGNGESLELSNGRLFITSTNGETLIFDSLK